MRRRRSRRTTIAAAVAAGAVLLAGCGDGSGDADGAPPDGRRSLAESSGSVATATTTDAPGSPGEGPPREEPVTAYVAWLDALARHDAETACALQAPEFTIELRYRAILEDRAELGDPCTGFVAILSEDPAFEREVIDASTTQVTGEDALLAVHLGQAEGRRYTVRMVYHRAKWRVFSVEPRTGDGASPGPTPGMAAGPDRWVDAWCDLAADMTRDQIIGLMGEPSGEYTVDDGGEPQLWWAQDQYDFRVYLDVDGSVLELVGDYDALSAADRAQLPCPELRS